MVNGAGRVMGVLDGGGDRRRGRGSFGNEFGAFHCNQWELCCVVVEHISAHTRRLCDTSSSGDV